ncbi:hypothetical protein BGX26_000551 [Mortierella sp. AD094]|nr:hypothetical protein BGX26_000551 [Mortierella sp. AD094]
MNLYRTHPLLLSEVLYYVSYLVESKYASTCTLVCKSWYTYFKTLAWGTCIIDSRDELSRIPEPEVRARVNHIRKLVYRESPSPRYLTIQYPFLNILVVQDKNWESEDVSPLWLSVAVIIGQCPTLTTIQLSAKMGVIADEVWVVMTHSPNLTVLQLEGVYEYASFPFWRACMALKRLEMDTCTLTPELTDYVPILSSMQELKLVDLTGISPEEQFFLLTRCPNLKSIYWRGCPFPVECFEESYSPGYSIESLDLKGNIMGDLSRFFDCTTWPIKKLSLVESQLDANNLRALAPCFHALRELDFTRCRRVNSKDITALLWSCPLLTSFKAGTLFSSDIGKNGKWACSKLSVLHLNIEVDDDIPENGSRRVFGCLSRLEYLEELNLAEHSGKKYQFRLMTSLQLRLDYGLAQLSMLWRMRILFFEDGGQSMTVDEGRWIRDNWKMLQVVKGRFNKDPEINAQVRRIIQHNK